MSPKNITSEETVYLRIKAAIRKRYIRQGSKLVETTLADKLGVSRTPIRSAIRRLEEEGLVNTVPNRGAFVITPTQKEIEEAFQIRTALEAMAIEEAAKKRGGQQIDELRQLIDKEDAVLGGEKMEDYWQINDAIHLKIAEISGNTMLVSYVRKLLDRTSLYLVLYDPFSRMEYSPTVEHERLFIAVQSGSVQEAREAIVEHLRSSIAYIDIIGNMPEDYISL